MIFSLLKYIIFNFYNILRETQNNLMRRKKLSDNAELKPRNNEIVKRRALELRKVSLIKLNFLLN